MRSRPVILTLAMLMGLAGIAAAQVPVRHKEGLLHGFLSIKNMNGDMLGTGDLTQNVRGERVTLRLTFRFKDGSVHDDTTTYSQASEFRLISDHLVQKGPQFPHDIDMTTDGQSGEVKLAYRDEGKDKSATEKVSPEGLANGIALTLIKNLAPNSGETKLSMVVATPKPRLVKLLITPQDEQTFTTSGQSRKALRFRVKVDLGALTGALASMAGKQPPDTNVWIHEGDAPAFVKSEGPLAPGGAVYRIELVSPVWPKSGEAATR